MAWWRTEEKCHVNQLPYWYWQAIYNSTTNIVMVSLWRKMKWPVKILLIQWCRKWYVTKQYWNSVKWRTKVNGNDVGMTEWQMTKGDIIGVALVFDDERRDDMVANNDDNNSNGSSEYDKPINDGDDRTMYSQQYALAISPRHALSYRRHIINISDTLSVSLSVTTCCLSAVAHWRVTYWRCGV